MELLTDLLDQGRTLFIDNFYARYPLAKILLTENSHTVGTLRANKKGIYITQMLHVAHCIPAMLSIEHCFAGDIYSESVSTFFLADLFNF